MTDRTSLLEEVARAFRDHGITAAITALIGGTLALLAAITRRAFTNDAMLARLDRELAAERERVFAKFFRGDGASGLAGAGLGLAISKAVVEAHGGRIVAGARDDGPGARFAFTIPTSTPPPAPGDGADAEAA